jgi:hypothetical protein
MCSVVVLGSRAVVAGSRLLAPENETPLALRSAVLKLNERICAIALLID